MEMSNKTYDILKIIALIVLPASATFVLALSTIWGIGCGEQLAATITAFATFLGACLKVSSDRYRGDQNDKE